MRSLCTYHTLPSVVTTPHCSHGTISSKASNNVCEGCSVILLGVRCTTSPLITVHTCTASSISWRRRSLSLLMLNWCSSCSRLSRMHARNAVFYMRGGRGMRAHTHTHARNITHFPRMPASSHASPPIPAHSRPFPPIPASSHACPPRPTHARLVPRMPTHAHASPPISSLGHFGLFFENFFLGANF